MSFPPKSKIILSHLRLKLQQLPFLQGESHRNPTRNWRRSTGFGRWKRASSRPRDQGSRGTCKGSALRSVRLSVGTTTFAEMLAIATHLASTGRRIRSALIFRWLEIMSCTELDISLWWKKSKPLTWYWWATLYVTFHQMFCYEMVSGGRKIHLWHSSVFTRNSFKPWDRKLKIMFCILRSCLLKNYILPN